MQIMKYFYLNIIIIFIPFLSLYCQEISLPDCGNVQDINFDVSEVIDFENRFLYEGQTDTLESLYCFAKKTGNKELEAIALFKFASEYHEILENSENLISSLSYLNSCIELSKKNDLYVPWFWAIEKKATLFTSNSMYVQASIFAEELIPLSKKLNSPDLSLIHI